MTRVGVFAPATPRWRSTLADICGTRRTSRLISPDTLRGQRPPAVCYCQCAWWRFPWKNPGDLSSSSARTALLVTDIQQRGHRRVCTRGPSNPKVRAHRVLVIADGQGAGSDTTGAALSVGVVESWSADAHGHICLLRCAGEILQQATVSAHSTVKFMIGKPCSSNNKAAARFAEVRGGALQLRLHGF